MTSDFAFLRRLYNAFDPFQPLPVGDSAYVDCNAVRGDGDILQAVGFYSLLEKPVNFMQVIVVRVNLRSY